MKCVLVFDEAFRVSGILSIDTLVAFYLDEN